LLDLRVFEIFVRVAEVGSMTKAAIGLDVSHSVLSRQITALERSLGYRVFERTGRGVTLTDSGKQLFPRAKELLRSANELAEEAKAIGGAPSGMVSIGLPGSIASVLAGPLFPVARSLYPKVSIRFVEALSGVIDELLTLGRIDLGLYYTKKANARRGEVPLCVVEMFLVAPAGDRLTSKRTVRLKQLKGLPLILPSFPHALRRLVEESCAQQGFAALVPFEVDSLSTMKEVVAEGGGYTVAPYDAIAHDVAAGRVRIARITNPSISRLLVMAPATKGPMTAATSAIAKLISSQVREWVAQGRWNAKLP
jgi:LysR family nitrogen assimilation transcriptional regulator